MCWRRRAQLRSSQADERERRLTARGLVGPPLATAREYQRQSVPPSQRLARQTPPALPARPLSADAGRAQLERAWRRAPLRGLAQPSQPAAPIREEKAVQTREPRHAR